MCEETESQGHVRFIIVGLVALSLILAGLLALVAVPILRSGHAKEYLLTCWKKHGGPKGREAQPESVRKEVSRSWRRLVELNWECREESLCEFSYRIGKKHDSFTL